MGYVLMVIAGLWMADGIALVFAPGKMIAMVKHSLAASPSLLNWSGVTAVLGVLLVLGGWNRPYQLLWVFLGLAMVGKGIFLVAAPNHLRQLVVTWCLQREPIDYKIFGILLCLMSILLLDATGVFQS